MCLITAGLAAQTTCTGVTPGINNDAIWFFNQTEAAWGTITSGAVSSVTMDATKTSFRVDIHKGSGVLTQTAERNEDTGAVTVTYTFTARVANVSTTTRNFLNSLLAWNGTVVPKTKSDTFPILGIQGVHDPMQITTATFTTDEGEFGGTIELVSKNNKDFAPHFFDTDVATTQTELEATE